MNTKCPSCGTMNETIVCSSCGYEDVGMKEMLGVKSYVTPKTDSDVLVRLYLGAEAIKQGIHELRELCDDLDTCEWAYKMDASNGASAEQLAADKGVIVELGEQIEDVCVKIAKVHNELIELEAKTA